MHIALAATHGPIVLMCTTFGRSERKRRWREENAEYVEEYNAGRRERPFETACGDCGIVFDAVRRIQVRCPVCQAIRRAAP
jgi:uncharacterized OB-fold protein